MPAGVQTRTYKTHTHTNIHVTYQCKRTRNVYTRVHLCITFRVRIAVDGRRELSLKHACDTRETRVCGFLRVACSTHARAHTCVWHTGREAFDPDRNR